MEQWQSFLVVIAIQLAIFVFGARLRGEGIRKLCKVLAGAIVLGIIFGSVFDLLLGSLARIFTYTVALTPIFVIVNGAFSYGLALATAWLFPIAFNVPHPPEQLGLVLLISAGAAAFMPAVLVLGPISSMLIFGAVVLLAGEGVVTLVGHTGPLLRLFL